MDMANKSFEESQKERDMQHQTEKKQMTRFVLYIVFGFMLFFIGISLVSPVYGIWEQRLKGEAELARAESNRQIRILEAKAEQEASRALADAEVIRADGVARANKIIGDSLQNNEGYLRYLWIQGLQSNQMQVVYVPTEANLPIMEATRMAHQTPSAR